jgi:transposase
MVERRRSRLALAVQSRLVEHFVAGTPARVAAELAGIHRNSAILFYRKLREIIFARTREAQPFAGEVEVDESYFGGYRKGIRGRGAAGKVPVFGLLKRGGQVPAPAAGCDRLQRRLLQLRRARRLRIPPRADR